MGANGRKFAVENRNWEDMARTFGEGSQQAVQEQRSEHK